MTTAVKRCPHCGANLVWQYDSYDISEREVFCLCGWRPVLPAPPLTQYDREAWHQPVSETKKAKIQRELLGKGNGR